MKFFARRQIIFAAVLLAAFTVVAFPFSRHRFHSSLTRIDYNAEQKVYEITIQLFPHDLVPVLEQKSGKRVDLEKTADIDILIFNYLNENFVLTDKNNAAKPLVWVGKEVEIDSMRVYLETAATENPEGYKLKNTIFLSNFQEQINLVVCRYDGKQADLLFKAGDKLKEITENKPLTEK